MREETKNGMMHYEFKYKDANGNTKEAEYDASGMAVKS